MCGINGFYNYSKQKISSGKNLIKFMNIFLKHRGPDDSGIWIDEEQGIYLGHQRLSILDLSSRGHQPMISHNGNVIVYNGEIYNYKYIKKELKEFSFFSDTDTEVLLYLYEKYGEKCLEKLNGMFSFAIWNNSKRELFLVRDRIGIKPLYYTTMNGIFAFSSEIKALFTLPWIRAELDEEALYHFLIYNYVFPPQTVFKNIKKFHPGYKMVVREDGIKKYEPYWEVNYSDYSSLKLEDLKNSVLTELKKSVQYQIISDVPIGTFLSGGVDSSAVTVLVSQSSSSQVKTYTIGFESSPNYNNDILYARKISKLCGTNHFEKIITPQELIDFLPRVVDIYDEPLADATSIPIYFLSKLAKENGTKVVLTGDGGDELFCGYRRWMWYVRVHPIYDLYFRLPGFIKFIVSNIYRKIDPSSSIYDILHSAAKNKYFLGGIPGFKESTRLLSLNKEFQNRAKDWDSYNEILKYKKLFDSLYKNGNKKSYIDWLCFVGLKAIIPNFYLYRGDHLGMANSVEIRVPFLDHTFVNFILSIPGKWKINKGEPKFILKKSLEKILPKEILYRKKQGFCVPLKEWIGNYLIEFLDSNLRSFCRETGLFNEEGLRRQINETKKGNINYTFSLWNIYFLIAWFKKWIL